MTSADLNNNETIDDEVLRIIREAKRPLSLNLITDQSDLFDGPAPVAQSLNRLVAFGSLCCTVIDNGRKRLYTLRYPVPEPEETAPDAAKAPHTDLITDAPTPTPLIALRSDGIVEIRRADASVIEITPDEMAELQRFVASIRSARG